MLEFLHLVAWLVIRFSFAALRMGAHLLCGSWNLIGILIQILRSYSNWLGSSNMNCIFRQTDLNAQLLMFSPRQAWSSSLVFQREATILKVHLSPVLSKDVLRELQFVT